MRPVGDYSVADAARLLGVSADSVRRACSRRELASTKTERGLRILRSDVETQRAQMLQRLQAIDAREVDPSIGKPSHMPLEGPSDVAMLRARISELEEFGRRLVAMQEEALGAIRQRLVADSLND